MKYLLGKSSLGWVYADMQDLMVLCELFMLRVCAILCSSQQPHVTWAVAVSGRGTEY